MFFRRLKAKSLLLCIAAGFGVFALSGCDDHVRITRDPDLHIAKHATWAWRPMQASTQDSRPVISRDVISRGDTVVRDTDANNEKVREQVKTAIEHALASKGLTQVNDPAEVDFLADYHFAVRRHNVTVQRVYPGAYPGIVCGPFGCWQGWGWGPPGVGFENIRFREGTIVFDFLKTLTEHQAYRAVGEKPVQPNTLSLTQGEINELVGHLLKDLKPGK
jgi:hypothetical protein